MTGEDCDSIQDVIALSSGAPKTRLPRLGELRIACRDRRALEGEHALVVCLHEDSHGHKPKRSTRLGKVRIGQRRKQRLAYGLDRERRKAGGGYERQARRELAL